MRNENALSFPSVKPMLLLLGHYEVGSISRNIGQSIVSPLFHSELRIPGIVAWKKKGIVTKEQAVVNLSFFIFLRMINVNQYRKLLCGGCYCFICVLEAIGLFPVLLWKITRQHVFISIYPFVCAVCIFIWDL